MFTYEKNHDFTTLKDVNEILSVIMADLKVRRDNNRMKNRETAIKTPRNGRVETPELRSKLDYSIGDYVQLGSGARHTGRTGIIIGVRVIKKHSRYSNYELLYTVRLSDNEAVEVDAENLRFLRHGEPISEEDE